MPGWEAFYVPVQTSCSPYGPLHPLQYNSPKTHPTPPNLHFTSQPRHPPLHTLSSRPPPKLITIKTADRQNC